MRIVRIYTGADKQSHFEEFDVPMSEGRYGQLSELIATEGLMFRQTQEGGFLDYHNAPRRQFVVTLSGRAEVELGNGTKREIGPGVVMLADDLTGQGHITREIEPRAGLVIPLPDDFDVDTLRA